MDESTTNGGEFYRPIGCGQSKAKQIVASTAAEVWQEGGDLVGPLSVVAYRTLSQDRIAAVCDNAPFGDWGNTSLLYNLIQWLAGS